MIKIGHLGRVMIVTHTPSNQCPGSGTSYLQFFFGLPRPSAWKKTTATHDKAQTMQVNAQRFSLLYSQTKHLIFNH